MRVGMGLIKNEHGVWHVRKKVPTVLEAAVATLVAASKPRVSWLKETLRTKDPKEAKVRAKPVMMKFDRVLAQAEALLAERPLRANLSDREIQQIADYFYAHALNADEELRQDGSGEDDALFASIHDQLITAGIEFKSPFEIEQPRSGLSNRMMHKIDEDVSIVPPPTKEALARGNIDFIRYELNELLRLFRINLDPHCADYRKAGMALMRAWVRALQDISARQNGEPIETPKLSEPSSQMTDNGEGLGAAYAAWLKAKKRSPSSVREFA
jgi:hypothetical protein